MSSVLVRQKRSLDDSTLNNSASGYSFDKEEFSGLLVLFILLFIIIIGYLKDREDHQDPLADKYSMEIKWSNEDSAYIVTVPELPGCKTHGNTYEEAIRRGKDAIESWIEASEAWGDPIPPPRVTVPV